MKRFTLRVVIAALLSLGLSACGPKGPTLHSLDEQTLASLKKSGSDLGKPHEIEFFTYFKSKAEAALGAKELLAQGYTAKLMPPDGENSNWLCVATKKLVPSDEEIMAQRALFTELATRLGGKFDGWGSEVVK